jgi:hypothetical protein
VDLLGYVCKERTDKETSHRGRPRQDAWRNAQTVLLARLPAPLKPAAKSFVQPSIDPEDAEQSACEHAAQQRSS